MNQGDIKWENNELYIYIDGSWKKINVPPPKSDEVIKLEEELAMERRKNHPYHPAFVECNNCQR